MTRDSFGLPMALPGMRIGLLGGSFNPAHEAHLAISLEALKRIGLDQVWWLVTPGNPLKQSGSAASLELRAAAAAKLARHPRIKVTDFEKVRGSAFTVDTVRHLQRRFPEVHFVWLMGADNLAGFHRWKDWRTLFQLLPIAVFDRPGFRLKAQAGQAAQTFAKFRIDQSDAARLALLVPPAWTLISLPLSQTSSTALRQARP